MAIKKICFWGGGVVFGVIIILVAILCFTLGVSPSYLYHAPKVATGIGAKLSCSARYVSGFDAQTTAEDIQTYSPILSQLNYQYDDTEKRVFVDLKGIITRSASYQEGLGCWLDYEGSDVRQALARPEKPPLSEPWPSGDMVSTIEPEKQLLLDDILRDDNRKGYETRALLVVHRQQIIAEAYAEGITPQTPLLGWSMTKSINALLLGSLAGEEQLYADQKPVFDEWKDDERKNIALKNLLQMTDGLDFKEVFDPGNDAANMLFNDTSTSQLALSKGVREQAGDVFYYSSGTANLISRFIQRQFEDDPQKTLNWIWQKVFYPMGIFHAQYEVDASGQAVGSSYLFATAREWARFGLLMLNKGEINQRQIVPAEWVEASIQINKSSNRRSYGYQWWLNYGDEELKWPALPDDSFAARGNRMQWMLVVPSKELVIVRLGWTKGQYPYEENFGEILEHF